MDRHAPPRTTQNEIPPRAIYYLTAFALLPAVGGTFLAVALNGHAAFTALVLFAVLIPAWVLCRMLLGPRICVRVAAVLVALGAVIAIGDGAFVLSFVAFIAGCAGLAVCGWWLLEPDNP